MAASVFVLAVDRGRESFHRADEQFAILLGRFGEFGDLLFDLVAHHVERFAERSDLRHVAGLDTRRKIAGSDLFGRGQGATAAGHESARQIPITGQRMRTQAHQPRLRPHFTDRCEGLAFVLHRDNAKIEYSRPKLTVEYAPIMSWLFAVNAPPKREQVQIGPAVRFLPFLYDLQIVQRLWFATKSGSG